MMRQVSSTFLESLGIPWAYRDQVATVASTGMAFVVNLDSSGGDGTHWTAARVVGNTLYYADPFGTILNGWPPMELSVLASKHVVNRVAFQRPKSTLCGYYAICFATMMDCIDRPLTRTEFETVLYHSIL